MEDLNQKTQLSWQKQQKIQKNLLFKEQIQKTQQKRQKLIRDAIMQKKQQKQNLRPYRNKKMIIPASLNYDKKLCKFIQPKVFRINNLQRRWEGEEEESSMNNNIQFQEAECTSNADELRNQLKTQNQQRWRLQMTLQEINSLFFGKQPKNSKKLRQKYMSDNQIEKSKFIKLCQKNTLWSKSHHHKIRLKSSQKLNIQPIYRDKNKRMLTQHQHNKVSSTNSSTETIKRFQSLKKISLAANAFYNFAQRTQPINKIHSDHVTYVGEKQVRQERKGLKEVWIV